MNTLITFLRHAKSYRHKEGRPLNPGPGLTKTGREQAEKTAEFLKGFKFDLILTSDLARARDTAEIVCKHQSVSPRVRQELAEHHVSVYKYSILEKDFIEGAGTLSQARKTVNFFKKILKKYQGKKILIVGHGNVIRGCVGTAMGFPLRRSPELHLFNCSLSSCIFDNKRLAGIYYLNSIDHYRDLSFPGKLKSFGIENS